MRYSEDAFLRAQKVKMIILDVDGVLTDGSVCVGADGELFKTFNVRDGLGITLAQKYGIKTAIITGTRVENAGFPRQRIENKCFLSE